MLKILISGAGVGGHGEQIAKALRMSKLNFHIVGSDCYVENIRKDFFDEVFSMPKATDPNYENALFNLIDLKKIDVLFHGNEPEMFKIAEFSQELSKMGVFVPVNNSASLKLCTTKNLLNTKLKELGFEPPRSLQILEAKNIEEIDFFPVVIKPSVGSGGSENVYICQDKHELLNLLGYLKKIQTPLIAQEYVGDETSEYTVGVLSDSRGTLINSIAMRRNLQNRLSVKTRIINEFNHDNKLGKFLVVSSGVSQGEINNFENVREFSVAVSQALHLKYSINIQCRIHQDKIKIFEINPRFSGTTSARALLGYNEPEVLIRKEVLKEEIEIGFKYRFGIVTRSLLETVSELQERG